MADLYSVIQDTVRRHPERVFLSNHDGRLTYQEVEERTSLLAERLSAVGQIDRPCLIKAAEIPASIGILACLKLGKPFIVVNPNTPPDRFKYYQLDSGANIRIQARESDGSEGGDFNVDVDIEELNCGSERWSTIVDASSVACLIYTSGTTGKPKAVVCSSDAVYYASRAISESLGYESDDVILTALPVFFDFGMYQLFLAGINGATVYFASAIESGFGLGEALARTGATILPMVPPAAEKLASLVRRGLSHHSVRMITTTGAAVDEPTRSLLTKHWGGQVDLRVTYGLTECKRVAIMPPLESAVRTKASGLPLPGTKVTIRPFGAANVLDTDESGEICVEGPHLMAGYHNQPELTKARFQQSESGVVLRTGDTGYLDRDGYLHCLGRTDAQFKVQGYRVSSTEIVAAAKEENNVTSAAVVPPSNQNPYSLFFQGDADEETVERQLKDKLEPYAVPKNIRRLDNLPTNANGKVDLKQLERLLTNG